MRRLFIIASAGYCVAITLSALLAMKGPEQGGNWPKESESPEHHEKKELARRLALLAQDMFFRMTEFHFVMKQDSTTRKNFAYEAQRVLLRELFSLTSADEEAQRLTLLALGESSSESPLKPRSDDPPVGGGSHVVPDLEGNWPSTKRVS